MFMQKQTLINAHVLNVCWISMAFLTQLMEIVCNVIATMVEVQPTFVKKIKGNVYADMVYKTQGVPM